MPALDSPKHEAFCCAVVHGKSTAEAHRSAGFSHKWPAQNGSRLLKKDYIRNRIGELRAEREIAVSQRTLQGEIQTVREVQIASRDGQVRLKSQRYAELLEIVAQRAAYFADPENQYVKQLGGVKNMPGVLTGLVVLRFKTVANKPAPFLELDTGLMREMSNLEEEVGRMMGFLDPIQAQKMGDTSNVIYVVQCEADLHGQA